LQHSLLALAIIAAAAGPAAAAGDGRYLYTLHCSGCHVPNGSGSVEGRIPALAGVVGHFQKLPEGRLYTLQVPGIMNSGLKDDDVAALVNWMVPHFAGGSLQGTFTPYTTDEVAAARSSRPTDIFAARRAITADLRTLGVTIADY
jgi:mono/diheme cytochrome c family protein